jgi:hypothetical protein
VNEPYDTGFAGWGGAERMAANVRTLYRGYPDGERASAPGALGEMAKWERRRGSRRHQSRLGLG